ncbi:hypothetical protein MBLNU457_6579t1 [Dothideomycetes sp. NU457]
MKTTIFSLVATIALASAQSMTDFPACAVPCVTKGLTSTTCEQTDISCICKAQSFMQTTQTCVSSSCSDADMQKAIQMATALCAGQGVTIDIDLKAASAGNSTMTSSINTAVSTNAAALNATATGSFSMITDKPAATTAAMSLAGAMGTSTGTARASSTVAASTGAADALKAGSWLGVAALVGLAAL